ncbi:MAG: Ig-like domain-containing protein, partial [Myxococcales bacterium]|nr:Ig-like domain-containing protein [Myxococcales bacterium]
NGWNPGLTLATVDGTRVELDVRHFSGLGAALAAPASLQALQAVPLSGTTQAFTGQIAAACAVPDGMAIEDALRRWYDDILADQLRAADSDPKLADALRDYLHWVFLAEEAFLTCGLGANDPDLGNRIAEARTLAADALRGGIQRADVRCRAVSEGHGAEDQLRWQAIAEALDLADPGSGLTVDEVVAGLCIEILYRNTDYTSSPSGGVTSPLTIEAELHTPSLFLFQPISVEVDARGTQETGASGNTDGFGVFTAPFTPLGGQPVEFVVESCADFPEFPKVSEHVCQTAIIGRGLEVTPATAQVQSGGTQQFSALLLGDPYANVDWSATSGTIDANGLFTADAPGTVTVTAMDQSSSLQASATVTVAMGACDFGTFQPNVVGFVRADDPATATDEQSSATAPVAASATDGTNSGTASAGYGPLSMMLHMEGANSTFTSARYSDRIEIDSGDPSRIPNSVRIRGRIQATGASSSGDLLDVDLRFTNAVPNHFEFEEDGSVSEDEIVEVEIFADGGSDTPQTRSFLWRTDLTAFAFQRSGETDLTASFQWLGVVEVLDADGLPIPSYTSCSASGTEWRDPQ